MSKGVELIAAERQRQLVVEGWTPEHDAEQTGGELALAAACYAVGSPIFREERFTIEGKSWLPHIHMVNVWPWLAGWWKPKNRLHDLARAGALIAAEIDRLLSCGDANTGEEGEHG